MAKRSDNNQSSIMDDLRKMGYSVESTHTLGKGRPDIIVGKYGFNFWIEIKNPEAAPADRKLTSDEQDWHAEWKGHKFVGHTSKEIHKHITEFIKFARVMG